MSDHKEQMALAKDGFAQLEQALTALGPWAAKNLTPADLAAFRKARRDIRRTHADLAEIAENINGGKDGEFVTLGSGT
jgi:glutathione S-transferase